MLGRSIRFLALLLLTGVAYAYTWYWLYVRWTEPDTFFAHGFLIPAVFLWLVHRRRECLARLEPSPSIWGLPLIILALCVHICAMAVEIYSPSGFTLPVLMAGIILYCWGWPHLKLLLFPVAFLFFGVPWPMNWVQAMSFRLKIMAVEASTQVTNLLGTACQESGSFILFAGGERLLVGDPCSGLRSLIALVALGILYVMEFLTLNRAGRILFILLTVPIAMVSNIIRIVFLCLLAGHSGVPATQGLVHDLSGYAIYAVALVLMIGCGRIMEALPFFQRRKSCALPG
jgi:exosortase